MGIPKINLPSNNYANNPNFVGANKPFSRPTPVSTSTMTFKPPASVLSGLSKYSLPTTFAHYGVDSMVSFAKSLYEKKLLEKQEREEKKSEIDFYLPQMPDKDEENLPIPYQYNFPTSNSSTLMDVLSVGVDVNKELVKVLSSSASLNSSTVLSLSSSLDMISKSVYDLASVNASIGAVVADSILSIVDAVSARSMSVEEIEYRNLEIETMMQIRDALLSSSSSSPIDVKFPDSMDINLKTLPESQNVLNEKYSKIADYDIDLKSRRLDNVDNEIQLVNKNLEIATFELEPISFENFGDNIPSLTPIEAKAFNSAISAKFYSDNNTLEFDSDDFDMSFDFPDITSLFEFNKKSERLSSIRGH